MERDGQRHLTRPVPAVAVDAFFDEHEARYPVIDNFADEGAGLTHGLAAEGTTDLGDAAPALLRYVLFRMPWQQFRLDLDAGDVQPPAWDLDAARAQGPALLVDSLPNDHRFKPLAQRAQEAGLLTALMDDLGDDELVALCDYRAASRRARRRFERVLTQFDPQGPPVRECPRLPDSRGGLFDYFWRTRDLVYGGRLEAAQDGAPAAAGPIAVFVHNHTHLVDWRQSVLELTRLGRTVIVDGFSAGAQRPLARGRQRRPVAADDHTCAVRPPAGRARSLRRRAAAHPAARASRALLRLRADRSLRRRTGASRDPLLAAGGQRRLGDGGPVRTAACTVGSGVRGPSVGDAFFTAALGVWCGLRD